MSVRLLILFLSGLAQDLYFLILLALYFSLEDSSFLVMVLAEVIIITVLVETLSQCSLLSCFGRNKCELA